MTARAASSPAALHRRAGLTRRGWLGLTRHVPAILAVLLAAPCVAEPAGYTVSLDQIDQALTQRFPLRLAAGGLLQLTLEQPRLRPLPAMNRMAASMVLVVAGPALASSAAGQFDLDFGLRYERGDRTLRAHDLRVRSLRVAGLPPAYPGLLEGVSQALADRSLGEVVLHRLRTQDLALAEVMGLEPDTVTVTATGLVIGFAAKPTR
jgi:hypothetical protein